MRVIIQGHLWNIMLLLALAAFQVAGADTLKESSSYFRLSPDRRLCPSPMCGGVFVSGVNQERTRCADGSLQEACYVAKVDYRRLGLDDKKLAKFQQAAVAGLALVRGRLKPGRAVNGQRFGHLVVNEGWLAATDVAPTGIFFRLRDNGIRCITTPCFSVHEAKLNSINHREISGVDFTQARATDEQLQAAGEAITTTSLLAAGRNRNVNDAGPAGDGVELVASQFYLRVDSGNRP